jgi:1-acyl-sn-glycerol-3-phosphate acyltransferase
VLIAANHVTWLDGFFLAAACPRRGHALVNAAYVDWPVIGAWARWIGLIPVHYRGPRAQRAMFDVCRKVLDEGGVLGLFPEAQMTRNGLTGPFYRGLEVILVGREHVAVVPMFLENLWGSTFSYFAEEHVWKRPSGLRRTVVVVFGPPVAPPVTAFSVRQAVLEAGVTAIEHRADPPLPMVIVDLALPHLDHPVLGLLAGSTTDYDKNGIHQTGQKLGTAGHPLPGIALRVVNEAGEVLPPDVRGLLLARVPGRDWTHTGHLASLDRDGFVRLLEEQRARL